ncbi:uncharacterized protein DUF397 [Actinomadura pelletieri DSM 43383]|uniref:Uncharacterized protein DUF397 n=1 Tax=Actinomadura pelletieri DSM 43383 TaxID=1120940 RepID=A0A495QGJ9_9ACTN|nr:DUF397 domain-containing protein [Actinomadura pelletieri]RKS71046.1 uncharacterized protein DUF397 [Actinomadura pelletieri DSM 43383]
MIAGAAEFEPPKTQTHSLGLPPERTGWRKSRFCGANTGCLEVSPLGAGITGIRDSVLDDSSPVIALDRIVMAGFLGRIKAGQFDLK